MYVWRCWPWFWARLNLSTGVERFILIYAGWLYTSILWDISRDREKRCPVKKYEILYPSS